MVPTSYQAPLRRDASPKPTSSQSLQTNLSSETATVRMLIAGKGRDVYAVRPQDTISNAVRQLRDKRIGALVVTDANGSLQGILSERDIVRQLAETPGQTLPRNVSDIMTREVVTCAMDDALVTVLKRMTDGKFRHMPVTEDGALSGMLTIGDVVNYRLNELEHEALQLKQLIVG